MNSALFVRQSVYASVTPFCRSYEFNLAVFVRQSVYASVTPFSQGWVITSCQILYLKLMLGKKKLFCLKLGKSQHFWAQN